MDHEEAVRLLKSDHEGVAKWNKWRDENPGVALPLLEGTNLAGSDLTDAYLTNCNLIDSNLSSANLHRAFLVGADLSSANLSSANLSKAQLSNVQLFDANLSGANLEECFLSKPHLVCANMQNVNLCGAEINNTQFENVSLKGADFSKSKHSFNSWLRANFSGVKGLEKVEHSSPSTLSLDTLFRSGDLPDEFLLGCGVPETLLEYVKALPSSLEPIQYYSCFISYSHKDEEFAQRLHGRLRQEGLRVWYAPKDMKSGQKIHHQIDQAIQLYDRLLLVLSEASMNSEWVATEIYRARQREVKEGKQVLFPIRLVDFERIKQWECFDADTGKDMAREIREYFIPNFTQWKNHDKFEASFSRLLADLKKSAEPANG